MQITRIECELGVTVNAGDFQSVKSTVKACADIDRNEDATAAYANLAEFVRASLVAGAKASHPDAVRKMLTGDARLIEAAADNAAAAEKKKPGPKPKTATQTTEKAIDDSIPGTGGGTASTSGPELDELDNLLGDAPAEPVTKQQVLESLTLLQKNGGKPQLLELFKIFGVGSLSQLPETKYAEAKAKADDMVAKIKAAQ